MLEKYGKSTFRPYTKEIRNANKFSCVLRLNKIRKETVSAQETMKREVVTCNSKRRSGFFSLEKLVEREGGRERELIKEFPVRTTFFSNLNRSKKFNHRSRLRWRNC